MLRAQAIAPWHLAVRTNLAAAYEMNGHHQEAAKAYESLLQTFPDFEESWLNLAVVRLHLGDYGKVREALKNVGAFQSDPRYSAIIEELKRVGR
jgi:tetratricopeptide (TPR) repeat protein